MKVCVFVGRLARGGAEKVASLWLRGFVSQGYEVSCIVVDNTLPVAYKIPPTVNTHFLNLSRVGLVGFTQMVCQLRSRLKNTRPDYLITVGFPLGMAGLLASAFLPIRVVNTEHNAFERPQYAPFSKRVYFSKFYINKLFYKVTVLSSADLSIIGNRLKNVVLLPNPLSIAPIEQVCQKEKVILAVARLESWYLKGLDILIEAWSRLHDKFPDWHIQILGDGGDIHLSLLIELSQKFGVRDSIDFVGFKNDPTPFFQKSSIYVLSSRCEGFGMALLEAMSQGCACVACDYNGRQSEIINSTMCGMTCKVNSVDDLTTALEYMLSHSNYRNSIRKSAIERSKSFLLPKVMEQWSEILR